jgi:hypothetical protein
LSIEFLTKRLFWFQIIIMTKKGNNQPVILWRNGNGEHLCTQIGSGNHKLHVSRLESAELKGDGETLGRGPERKSRRCLGILGEHVSQLSDAIGEVVLELKTGPNDAIIKAGRSLIDGVQNAV